MITLLVWNLLCASPTALAPAPAAAPVTTDLADPFAPPSVKARVPPGQVRRANPELLSPFAARHRNLPGPLQPSVRSPFDA